MAYTTTNIFKSVFGNKRVVALDVTADAASGVVVTGLSVVQSITLGPVSMATAAAKLKKNLNDSSATAQGSVFVSSAASGDNFILVCMGT